MEENVNKKTYIQRGQAQEGLTDVLTPGNALLDDLSVSRLRLDAKVGGYEGNTGTAETVLHILIGTCSIEVRGEWGSRTFNKLGERPDVFSGLSTTVVLGPRTEYSIVPISPTVDIVIASAKLVDERQFMPVVIRPQDVKVHDIGEEHYVRHVREVIGGDGPAVRLRVGETINPVGRWSSWPHHDFHANEKLAPEFEEVFLYFTKPRYGWGLQKRDGLFYNLEPVDDVLVVRNGDAAIMPLGDHPVVAGVDSQLMYIWFYVSPIPKIYAKWAEDIGGYA